MSAPRTRRAALRAGAALAAALCAPAVALALPAPAVDLDAELFRLLEQHRAAEAAWDAEKEPYETIMARALAAYPPRPNALQSGFGDTVHGLGVRASGRGPESDGRTRMFWNFDDVEALRAAKPATRCIATGSDPGFRYEINLAGEARRQEIIEAHDGWMRTRKAVEDATDYTAASAASEALAAALNAAEDAVKLCTPRTLAGLARKAAWVADLLAREAADDDLGEVFARQVAAFAGVSA